LKLRGGELQVFKLWGSNCKITETSWVKSEFSPFFFYIFILNSIQFNSIHAPDHIASLSLKSGPHHVDGGQRVNSDVGLHKKSHFFFLI
jgi:hypothetical protein